MICVEITKKENFLRSLKLFKKKLKQVGTARMVRKNRYFEKPSLARRKQKLKAIYIVKQQRVS